MIRDIILVGVGCLVGYGSCLLQWVLSVIKDESTGEVEL